MGDRRRTTCNVCEKHRDEVGEISWSGNCISCALAKMNRVALSLHHHEGPDFAKWRRAHAAAVGAIFPNEELRFGLSKLPPNAQKSTRKSRHWHRMSDARMAFAEGRCEIGLPGCRGEADHVHLNPALGGNHKLAKLDDCRAVCAPCHGLIHSVVSPAQTLAALDDERQSA